MHAALGLTRDPFAPVCDGPLFWESPARAEARRRARELLLAGTGVWLSGPPGSGRSTVLSRVAEDVALEGRRVLWSESLRSPAPADFVARLLAVVSDEPAPPDLSASAEALYAGVLEGFCAAGSILCFPSIEEPTVGSLAEAAILARFRLAGRPLAVLALGGGGEPPFAGLEKVALPAPTAADLEAFLVHRATFCGNGDALPPERLRAVSSAAKGFGDALARARLELNRAVFRASAPAEPGELGDSLEPAAGEAVPPSADVLDPAALAELRGLLDSLSSDL